MLAKRRGWRIGRLTAALAVILLLMAVLPPIPGTASVHAAGAEADTAAAAKAESYRWGSVPIGGGGYVTGIVVHPSEPDLVYIRTDVGGIYRWDETGAGWKQLVGWANRGEFNLYGGESIAIDPSNPNVVYAALGKYDYLQPSDIYKSTDRGETWTATGLKANGKQVRMSANGGNRTAGERLAVDPNDGSVVYFGSRYDGLFRSTEGAAPGSWTKVSGLPAANSAPHGVAFVLFDPASGSPGEGSAVLYAGVHNAGVYRSSDYGATWTLLAGSPAQPLRAAVDPFGKLYVAHNSGLAAFADDVWTHITPAADAGRTFGSVAIDPANPDRLIAARKLDSHGNPIYRSLDGGATWEKVPFARDIRVPWMPDWHWSSATSALAFDPFRPGRVWLTDWYYAWRTEDIYASPTVWRNDARGLETVVNVANLVSPPGGGAVLHSGIADNGGFDHLSLDEFPDETYYTGTGALNGLTTTGIDVQQLNPDFLVRVGTYGWNGDGREDPGSGGYSTDGGKTYTAFASLPYKGAQGGKAAVSAASPDVIVWAPQGGSLYYTSDRGETWQKADGAPSGLLEGSGIFGNYYQPLSADKVQGDTFYVYSRSGGFYRSVDGGKTWTKTAELPAQSVPWHTVEAAPGVMGEVWVGLNEQGLYRSSDGGSTFGRVPGVRQAFLFSFGKHAPGRLNPAVFVYGRVDGFEGEGIFRSDDMGATWVRASVANPFPGNDPNAMAGDRQVHGRVYVGTNGTGILYGSLTEPLAEPVFEDLTPPAAPAGLTASAASSRSIDLRWNASSDGDSGMKGYRLLDEDGTVLAETYGTSYSVSGLVPQTSYSFRVQAIDRAGNVSAPSEPASAATPAADVTPPAAPSGLSAAHAAAFRIELAWTPGQEDDLLGYRVYRSGTPGFAPSAANRIATLVTEPEYADGDGLTPETAYYYRVQAVDRAGNVSAPSAELAATTTADQSVEVIVDNLDAGFASDTPWTPSTYSASRYGANYFHDGKTAGKWAKWTPYITVPGNYNVYMLWNASADRVTAAPVEVGHSEGTGPIVKVNQTQNDNRWVYIGTYPLTAGSDAYVKIVSPGGNTTIADAVKFSLASEDGYGSTHPSTANAPDSSAPEVRFDREDGAEAVGEYVVWGRTSEPASLTIKHNGAVLATPYKTSWSNRFAVPVKLTEGTNVIVVDAVDRAGNRSSRTLTLTASELADKV
ncbi:fibronectin type III domain-containing protein [Cohnella xylanilytica]|uniref:Fibronectin type III domain-containing protein n=1 Tax=Cohnella xylanilytica TaxID=557555 RepID=A0A841UC54_9BACL|nr:fibronectin type III domain-containing protein [Cohnella xylanilytica]MBB6695531.1 fibronectin type III domain-containing protein [Cohnella xylanilytica]